VVEAAGPAVTDFTVGDDVFGVKAWTFGAHAEYVCMRQRAALAHKPAGIGFEEAAAVCDGVILALMGLRPPISGMGAASSSAAPRDPSAPRRSSCPGTSGPTSRYTKRDVLFLKGLMEDGQYRAVIDKRYPLADVVEASRYVDTGQKTGNVVLTVG